jgi:hypothetical protein
MHEHPQRRISFTTRDQDAVKRYREALTSGDTIRFQNITNFTKAFYGKVVSCAFNVHAGRDDDWTITVANVPDAVRQDMIEVTTYGDSFRKFMSPDELRSQRDTAAHANIVEEIALQLWKALGSAPAPQRLTSVQRWRIARTEATKAFNATKIAALRSYVTADDARDYLMGGVGPSSFLAAALRDGEKKLTERVHAELSKQLGVDWGKGSDFTKEQTMSKDKTIKPKRFYVGHTDTILARGGRAGWAKDTLPEALAHATERAEQTGEPQYVVKVIKVVRKKPQPIVVEDVK